MLHAEESKKYEVLDKIPIRQQTDFTYDDLFQMADVGIETSLEHFIYITYAYREKTIEGNIDISEPFMHLSNYTRKQFVTAFKNLCKLGLIEVLHSSNWKHHHVLIHPVKKVLEEKNK